VDELITSSSRILLVFHLQFAFVLLLCSTTIHPEIEIRELVLSILAHNDGASREIAHLCYPECSCVLLTDILLGEN
jgi:hypothetical protein